MKEKSFCNDLFRILMHDGAVNCVTEKIAKCVSDVRQYVSNFPLINKFWILRKVALAPIVLS